MHTVYAIIQHMFVGYMMRSFSREKVLLVVQQRHAGYVWDPEQRMFVSAASPDPARDVVGGSVVASAGPSSSADGTGGLYSRGTGYCMAQLAWAGEALVVGEDGVEVPVQPPVLEVLQKANIQ